MIVNKAIGLIAIAAGVVLAWNPELVSSQPIPEDLFEAVERRMRWGLPIGIGILLLYHDQLKPWALTAAATCLYLTIGFMVARIIGMSLDGPSIKQWYWLIAEVVLLFGFAYWYLNQRRKL